MAANRFFEIIPECYVDTNLIGYLVKGEVNHQKGCNHVACAMQKASQQFRVGIIDDDKRKNKYVDEFQIIAQLSNLELRKHPNRHHYFIIVKKAAEDFILNVAHNSGVNLSEVGLPDDLEGLKLYTKNCEANKDAQLQSAFKLLKNTFEIQVLRNVLRYLVENQYNSDVKVLKAFFG